MKKLIDAKATVIPGYTLGDLRGMAYAAERRSLATAASAAIPFMGIYPLVDVIAKRAKEQRGNCKCCSRAFKRGTNHISEHSSMTVHRVVPNCGYVEKNIEIICKLCNDIIGEGLELSYVNNILAWQQKQLENRNIVVYSL